MSKISIQEIKDRINNEKPIKLKFSYADENLILKINGFFTKLLTATDQLYIFHSVISIMREMIANAQKANAKRIYFSEEGLDINDSQDYLKGMENFKKAVISNQNQYKELLHGSDYHVLLTVKPSPGNIHISVANNAEIVPDEWERIQVRYEKAKEYNNFIEAYEDIIDNTEGAGLGIAMMVITMKSIGLSPDTLQVTRGSKTTDISFSIPREIKPVPITSVIKDNILNEIEGIPTFPEHTIRLIKMCNNPESLLKQIADTINKDPALTTDVLKLSNSAGFISGKTIETVHEAVKILGLNNIKSILMASKARHILAKRYSRYEEIWHHCTEVSFFARHIGHTFHGKHTGETAYLGGLLHDLGKIVLLAAGTNLTEKIAEDTQDRSIILTAFLEEISIGISHPTIGGLIAQKWNFPQYLVDTIKNHHSPLSAEKEHEDTVHSVYLANMICGLKDKKYNYFYFDEEILAKYNLENEAAFKKFYDELKINFDNFRTNIP